MSEQVYIIGVLDNAAQGLSSAALTHIRTADVLIGARRTLDLFVDEISVNAELRDLADGLTQAPQWINAAMANDQRVVVLATGDPMCHGIGSYLIKKLGRDVCTVLPNLSTIQLAFARLGLAWQNAVICSVHSRDAGEWSHDAGPTHGLYPVLEKARQHDMIALLTSPDNSPDRVARMLIAAGLGDVFRISIAERLLLEDEKVIADLSLNDAAKMSFADPNVVILQAGERPSKPLFGADDASFIQRKPDKGLITKREVRAVSLARMQLRADSVVWDIGAGSGSVGLEAAQLCRQGYVYAIEKNEADAAIAQQNCQRLAVTNYRLQHGKAPQHLDQWPDPDAVFVGGSGGELDQLIKLCMSRINTGGCLVMNFVTLENLAVATQTLEALGLTWDVTQMQASRSQPILHMHRMQAENPVWIVCAQAEQVNESEN